MAKLADIEGIGDKIAEKLKAVGITSVEELLEQGASPAGRKEIAEKTGISAKLVLTWVNHADLFRIKGVAGQYAELLEVAGVDTVAELARRKAENLHAAMAKANEEKKMVKVTPPLSRVTEWIEQAKSLPRVVKY